MENSKVTVRYHIHDDLINKTYYKEETGFQIDKEHVVTFYEYNLLGIDRIGEKVDDYLVVYDDDYFKTIFMQIENIDIYDIELSNETVISFLKYLLKQRYDK
ncbi:hypothetical protein ACOI1C_18375 [Bacillus sp. DJP31]|uniref:hypothetical protein n=1 Tax=Bacillus sp. DJP31 TaxID=3409789 RepID=UPI003BB7A08D